MEGEKELGQKIAYCEQMLKVYEDNCYEETLYQTALRQEMSKNRSKYKIYLVLSLVFVVLDMIGIYIAQARFLHANPTSSQGVIIAWGIGSISLLVGTLILAFTSIGTVLCVFKLIHYGKRRNREVDNRDLVWRSYSEMFEISKKKIEETLSFKAKTGADLSVYKNRLAETIEQKRLAYENGGDEQENISMSELFYVKETHREALPDKKEKDALVKSW